MDTDIHDAIDRSFGDGPTHPPVEQGLVAGRRALRRRRVVTAAAAGGLVVVLGGSYAVAASGPPSDRSTQIAVQPTASASPSEPAWEDDTPIRYLDGALEIRPGAVVHHHVENPYGYRPPKLSDALDLTYEGRRMWIIATSDADGFGYSSSVPSAGWATFAAWVADQAGSAGPGADGWPTTMRLDATGQVVAAAGAHVVQRTDDPRLGASFAPAGAPTGAAVVTVDGDDRSYFVVRRVIDGALDVITTPPRDTVGATFDELLSAARAKYASGEGLR